MTNELIFTPMDHPVVTIWPVRVWSHFELDGKIKNCKGFSRTTNNRMELMAVSRPSSPYQRRYNILVYPIASMY